ncbi:hypothetical protein F6V30_15135 [Oryzomonas sagensis]|uniref:Uncharacterized protein n=1 Tax=Oryzomonas sagensis TaxID=2603857 RepID=A0ABQ6TKW5_9BACT|nr:hypothetical protein F6V30_15135 [Oryzomonas sagensis]
MVIRLNMLKPELANLSQFFRCYLLPRPDTVTQFGSFETDELVIETVLNGLREAHNPHRDIFTADMFQHGIQQVIEVCPQVFIGLQQELPKHGVQLVYDAPVTTVAAEFPFG